MLTVVSGCVIVLPYVGYLLSSTLLTLAILHIMGLGRWPVKAGLAVAIGLGSYLMVKYLLGIQLPVGIPFSTEEAINMNPMQGIAYGFSVALLPENLIAALVGALLGTLTGVLPRHRTSWRHGFAPFGHYGI